MRINQKSKTRIEIKGSKSERDKSKMKEGYLCGCEPAVRSQNRLSRTRDIVFKYKYIK